MAHHLIDWFIVLFLFHGCHFVLAQQQQATVSNDMCTAAINVTSGNRFSDTYNTTGATADNEICGDVNPNDIGVWFLYQSQNTTVVQVTIDIETVGFVARLSVFEGSCANLINCLDISTSLSWVADAGVEYRLLVSGLAAATGQFTIEIEGTATPPNDECISAMKVTGNTTFFAQGNTNTATPDFEDFNNCASEIVRGVWYEYEATENRIVMIALTNPTFAYRIALFKGETCPPTCVDSVAVRTLTPYTYPFQAEKSEKYFILIAGYSTIDDVGTFSLSVEEEDIPPNDTCDNATAIDFRLAGYSGNTVGATTEEEFSSAAACGVDSVSRGLWFKYTPTVNMNITLQTSFGTFYHRIAVLKGESCDPTFSCEAFASSGNSRETTTITFQALRSVQYYFLVTGNQNFNYAGTFTLTMTSDVVLSPSPRPINAPVAPTPTEKPSLRPVNIPLIVPAMPSSPIALPPTNNPMTAQPTLSPMTVTVPPITLPPTVRPIAPISPTNVPTEQPTTRPTFPPVELTSKPTQAPITPPVNIPTIAPAMPSSPDGPSPTNNPITAQPTSSPITSTPPPMPPTERPIVPTSPTDVPTEQPIARPTFSPAVQPLRPTRAPVTPPFNVATIAPAMTSSPTQTPAVPPRELPTNVPVIAPSVREDPSDDSTCPDGSPGPYFPDECEVDCRVSGPSAIGCVKFCDVRPIAGCVPVCTGTVRRIIPGGCRERCCRVNNTLPTDLPTTPPEMGIVDTTDQPTTPMIPSNVDLGKGKGSLHYVDDDYPQKGKGRMYDYYSGKGKGRMHSMKGMGAMNYSKKGKGGYKYFLQDSDNDSDSDTNDNDNDDQSKSDHGTRVNSLFEALIKAISARYHKYQSWNERRRMHRRLHDAKLW